MEGAGESEEVGGLGGMPSSPDLASAMASSLLSVYDRSALLFALVVFACSLCERGRGGTAITRIGMCPLAHPQSTLLPISLSSVDAESDESWVEVCRRSSDEDEAIVRSGHAFFVPLDTRTLYPIQQVRAIERA
jgi:hypothetical protein